MKRALPGGYQPVELAGVPEEGQLYPLLESFERQIESRLKRFDGKVSKAAQDLGLERSHLYKKMQKLGLKR